MRASANLEQVVDINVLVSFMSSWVLRSVRSAGIGESADGRTGFASIRDWYALVMMRS